MSEDFVLDKANMDELFNEIVYLSKKEISKDGKSVRIQLSDDRGMIFSKEEVDSIVASVSEKKALEADEQVILNALVYIRINPKDEAYDNLKTLYERAYRKGFEAGKKEGTVKIKEVEKMSRVDNPKSKLAQLFCKHKHTDWYTKKSDSPFAAISGERRYLICEDCGKEIRSYFAEYEGMGFK